jgi:mono/diheme cytochrome c family protein
MNKRKTSFATRLLKGAGFPYATLVTLLTLVSLPASAETNAAGKAHFTETCAPCHGEGGVGIPGLAPPLVDSPLWSGLGDKAPHYFAGVVSNGMSGKISVLGQDYIGLVMPSQAALPDADLAAIGAYVLQDLNGLSVVPDEAMIGAAKATPTSHKALRKIRAQAVPK